jgi:hypothetical protein
MSKEQAGLTGMSEINRTMGEQSGSAKTHLDTVSVSTMILSKFMPKLINFTKFLVKI